jgi:hypothetical protein
MLNLATKEDEMSTWDQLQGSAAPSMTFDAWMQQQQQAADRNGGDAGTVIRPDDYAASVQYNLPGYGDGYNFDPTRNAYYKMTDPHPGGISNGTWIHNDGGQGIVNEATSWDNRPSGFDKFLDFAMPAAVALITGGAGAAAIGGAMGAGAAAGGIGAGDAAAGLAGEGLGAEGTAIGGSAAGAAADAAPAFTYGSASPWAWSQAGGTELGSGLYGTDAGSMAGLYGTTAGGADGAIGSALGTGVAADAAAPYALAGAADAGSAGLGLSDIYKMYQQGSNAVKLGSALSNMLNPQTPTPSPAGGLSQFLGGSSASNGGSGIGAGGIASAVSGPLGEAKRTDLTSPIQLIQPVQAGNFSAGNNNAGDKLTGYGAWHAQHG